MHGHVLPERVLVPTLDEILCGLIVDLPIKQRLLPPSVKIGGFNL